MSNNLKYLKEDFYKSVFFENKFENHIKIVDLDSSNLLSEIFLKKFNSLFNKNYNIYNINKLHENIEEKYKIYDQTFAVNEITTLFYDHTN